MIARNEIGRTSAIAPPGVGATADFPASPALTARDFPLRQRFRGLRWRALFLAIAPLAAAFASGCADRTYLTKSHGRAYSEAFQRQAVPPQPQSKGTQATATQGLDSQESAAVSRSYRKSLGGKDGGGETASQPMLIMSPGTGQQAPYLPPPSVPSGQ